MMALINTTLVLWPRKTLSNSESLIHFHHDDGGNGIKRRRKQMIVGLSQKMEGVRVKERERERDTNDENYNWRLNNKLVNVIVIVINGTLF